MHLYRVGGFVEVEDRTVVAAVNQVFRGDRELDESCSGRFSIERFGAAHNEVI